MPNTQDIVINTSPIIALVAALGDLSLLEMYRNVWVPLEVSEELAAGGAARFALTEFQAAHWLHKRTQPLSIAPHLLNTLDKGEASVNQLALDNNIHVTLDRPLRVIAEVKGTNCVSNLSLARQCAIIDCEKNESLISSGAGWR